MGAPVPFSGLSGQAPSPGTVGAPDDYQRVQASPEDFGAGVARAIQGPLTGGIQEAGQAAAQDLQFHNQIAADAASNQNMDRVNNLLYGDPNDPSSKGFFALHGADALSAYPQVAKQMEDTRQQIKATLPPMAALQFDADSRRFNMMMMQRAGEHNIQQQNVWNAQTAQSGIDNYLKGASLIGDDAGWRAMVGSAQHVQSDYLVTQGADTQTIKDATDKIQSTAAKNRAQQLALSNPTAAMQFITGNRQLFEPGDYVRLQEELQPKIDSATGKAVGLGQFQSQMAAPSDTVGFVKSLEGFSPVSKWDFSQFSSGYGTKANGPGETIDEPEANRRLNTELAASTQRVTQAASAAGLSLTPGQQTALISFDYNTGKGPDVIGASGGDPTKIVTAMSGYTNAGGQPNAGVAARRQKEIAMFNGGPIYPDESAGVSAILQKGLPEPQTNAAIAEYQRNLTEYRLVTETQRATIQKQFNGTLAELEDGKDDVSIAPATIRATFPPPEAENMIEQQNVARMSGQVFKSIQYGSPEDVAAARQDLASGLGTRSQMLRASMGSVAPADLTSETPDQYTMRQKLLTSFDTLVQNRSAALLKDPAGYVAGTPAVAAALDGYRNAQPADQPAAFVAYATAAKAAQARLGVPEQNQRVLGVQQSSGIAGQLLTADTTKVDVGSQLDQLATRYGDAWPDVWHDLVRDGHMPPEYQVLAVLPQGADRLQMQRALQFVTEKGGAEKLRQDVGGTQADAVDAALAPSLDGLRKSLMVPGMPGNPDLYSATVSAIRTTALYSALSGQDGALAVSKAADALPYDYIPQNTGMLGSGASFNARAPKGLGAAVESYAAGLLQKLTPQDLGPVRVSNPDVTADQASTAYLGGLRRAGVWVTNERDDGWYLAMPFGKTGYQVAQRPDGSRIGFKFSDLPRAAAGAPMPEQPVAPMFSGGS